MKSKFRVVSGIALTVFLISTMITVAYAEEYIFILKWGSQGTGDGQFFWPYGVSVDVAGDVYVADTVNDRVQKFNSSGDFILKWGSSGYGDGQFDSPFDVAVDGSGDVYVADCVNSRIQKFGVPPSVGGFEIAIDKLALLAPYIALVAVVVGIVSGSVYAAKRWLRKPIT